MQNPIKDGLYMGVGLALRTRDAITSFGRSFVNENKMTEEEGKRFVDDLVGQAEETRDRLQALIQEQVDRTLQQYDIARKSDIDRLESRIASLEQRLSAKGPSKESG